MIIKILSVQVPQFWEAIKYTIRVAEALPENQLQPVYIEWLHDLLNDKAQCFISLSPERRLRGLILSKIVLDKVTGEKYIQLGSLYAWEQISNEEYVEACNIIAKLGRKEGCTHITARSSNPRVSEIASYLGFKEKYKVYDFRL